MIKRINQYLITNHPQIWNTKLVWMALVIAVTHILFYIAGFLSFDELSLLHRHHAITDDLIESINVGFSVLVSVLMLIIWLVFYLRNNPFKSFYPLKPAHFLAEFSIILLIVFGTITFYKSFAMGFCQGIRTKTANVNLVEEINTFNLARGLMPQNNDDYDMHATCDSLDYIDSLRDLYSKSKDESSIHKKPGNARRYYITDYSRDDEYGTGNDTLAEAIRLFQARKKDDVDLRLTNYCQKECYVLDSLTYSKYQISAQIQQWLTTGNKKEVTALFFRFDEMCRKYEIPYTVSIRDYAVYAFENSAYKFYPSHFVNDNSTSTNNYIDFYEMENTLQNIQRAREGAGAGFAFWLLNLFIALNLSILLFTFRLTPLRVWFTAIAAHLALPIIVGLVEVFIHDEVGGIIFLLFLAFCAYALHFALRDFMKKTSGVLLIWFAWWLLYVGGFTYLLLEEISRPRRIEISPGVYSWPESPFHNFLNDYSLEIAACYMVFAFLYIGLILSRHYRKWMALPEE